MTQFPVYFEDPRFKMTRTGQFIVRIAQKTAMVLCVALALTLSVSGLKGFRFIGIFLILFLADKLLHFGKSLRPLDEIGLSKRANIAHYLEPSAFKAVEAAFRKSDPAGSDLETNLLSEILKTHHYSAVPEAEMAAAVRSGKENNALKKAERLLRDSFAIALRRRSGAVRREHLLEALLKPESASVLS